MTRLEGSSWLGSERAHQFTLPCFGVQVGVLLLARSLVDALIAWK